MRLSCGNSVDEGPTPPCPSPPASLKPLLNGTAEHAKELSPPSDSITHAVGAVSDDTGTASALYQSIAGLVSSLARLKEVFDTLSEVRSFPRQIA